MDGKSHFEFLDIVLSGSRTCFQAGEEVSGHIIFTLNGSSIVANIKIALNCVSEVQWVESPGSRYHRDGHTYYQKIKLFNQTYTVPKNNACLSEGEHEMPFKFKLKEKGMPSTFVGPHGNIKYYIEVINEEPGVEDGHTIGYYEFGVEAPIIHNLNGVLTKGYDKTAVRIPIESFAGGLNTLVPLGLT